MVKFTDFETTYDPKVTKSKGMQKTPEFDASYDPIVIKSKGMLKSTDFDANQSNLLRNVLMIYFYSKRFRFAPSFNNKEK